MVRISTSGAASGLRRSGTAAARIAAAAAVMASFVPAAAFAATPTTTTLDAPSGTQYGPVPVTAHVRPAPVAADGFIPAVLFVVDGGGGLPAPIDAAGDATTELTLPVGSHFIVASFGGFSGWDASASDPSEVRVGMATQTSLSSSRNPALATESVTISAEVAPPASGGTLSIMDAFDGSTIASTSVAPGTERVSVTRRFAVGAHELTATYSGDGDYGHSEAHLLQTIGADTSVDASTGVAFATFYPYRDGYRDTDDIRGTLREPATVVIRISSPANALIRTVNLGARSPGPYAWTWSGRNAAGGILPAGTYSVVQRLTDAAGNVQSTTHAISVSAKKLAWTTSTITVNGDGYAAFADTGDGYVSASRSAYARGAKLYSGSAGVGVAYRFTVHSAIRYGPTVAFGVLGRSPSGSAVAEGLWNRSYCGPLNAGCYDTRSMGPGYAWWSIAGSSGLHLDGRTAFGTVLVPYTGRTRSFDIAKVRLVYRWAVLR